MRVNLNTFSDVAERYAEVKPMVSKNHKREDDIRPISERHRKWERIAKVDDNCYILHDVIPYENYSWVDEHIKRPPITWSRDKHGDEFVTIHTVTWSTDQARMAFLFEYLPNGLDFCGGAYHTIRSASGSYYVPRSSEKKDPRKPTPLVFKRTNKMTDRWLNVWEHVSGNYTKPSTRIDKVAKKKLQPHIDEFFSWLCAVGPLIPDEGRAMREKVSSLDYSFRTDYNNHTRSLISHSYSQDPTTRDGTYTDYEAKRRREILCDTEHELRVHYACEFLLSLQNTSIRNITTQEELKALKSKFNAWANRSLGLNNKILGE
tara:strand:- start:1027 stop:1980 length:954 start_codon:yes stop_codon:yes gene_type:complete